MNRTKRFGLALGLLCGFLTMAFPSRVHSKMSFEYKDVIEEARLLAEKPFEEPKKVPEFLLKASYDQWRGIRFKPEEALWRTEKLPFEVQFFHPGGLYDRKVIILIVGPNGLKPVPFSPDLFHYGMSEFKDKIPQDLGFAGFRLHYPINTSDSRDEVAVFLGASYLRAVGRKQTFGISGRGLAVDTAVDAGEEFPYFRTFWIVRPQAKAKTITVYALLDSPSLTGAYEYVIRPGEATLIDVASTIFLRKEITKLGIAPLTSMFFYAENTNIRPVDDFRPEVHDTDGLLIAAAAGEWTWRPLINPERLLVTSFQLSDPKGFGLFQRDRDLDHYQDLEADYQLRPSVWIEPKNKWGEGRVELVQIPTNGEANDNTVAYWVPAVVPKAGGRVAFSYQMKWGSPEIASPDSGRVVATRTSAGEEEGTKVYLVDFAGEKLRSLPEDAGLEAAIAAGGGEVIEQHLQKNRASGGWRLVFQVKKMKEGALDMVAPGNNKPIELRAFLTKGEEVLTETWSYVDPF